MELFNDFAIWIFCIDFILNRQWHKVRSDFENLDTNILQYTEENSTERSKDEKLLSCLAGRLYALVSRILKRRFLESLKLPVNPV